MRDRLVSWLLLLTTGAGGAVAIAAAFLWYTAPMRHPFQESPTYLVASAIGLAVIQLGIIARRRPSTADFPDD